MADIVAKRRARTVRAVKGVPEEYQVPASMQPGAAGLHWLALGLALPRREQQRILPLLPPFEARMREELTRERRQSA